MNILIILDHFSPYIGGTEILFEQLTQQYISKGYKVTIITNKHKDILKNHEIINGISIYRVGSGRRNRIQMIQQGSKIINKHTINLIHTSTYSAAIPARILSKRYKIPNQIHVHEIYSELWHQFLGLKAYCNKRFEKLVVGLLPRDRYICVSRYALNSVRTHFNLPDHKLYLQSNPVDAQFWKPYNTEQEEKIRTSKSMKLIQLGIGSNELSAQTSCDAVGIIGLYYGRTGVEKGLHLYIQALPEIIKQYPTFHAVIIAPNQEPKPNIRSKKQTSHSLKKLIKQLQIESYITWLPPVQSKEDIRSRIAVSDVVILPSLTEGFGYAMHEVAMMNKNLITTSVGGQIETLSEYINTNKVGGKMKFSNIYWMKQVTSEEIIGGVKDLLS